MITGLRQVCSVAIAIAIAFALPACTRVAVLDLQTKDTLADGRKVLRLGDPAHVFLGEVTTGGLAPRWDPCVPVDLVSSDVAVLRILSHHAWEGGDTYELELVAQGDATLVGVCGSVPLRVDVFVTCASE